MALAGVNPEPGGELGVATRLPNDGPPNNVTYPVATTMTITATANPTLTCGWREDTLVPSVPRSDEDERPIGEVVDIAPGD
jgi:hypothetical protein